MTPLASKLRSYASSGPFDQNEKVPFERVKAILGQQFTLIILILIKNTHFHQFLGFYIQK